MSSTLFILIFLSICSFCHAYIPRGYGVGTFEETRKLSYGRSRFDFSTKLNSHEGHGDAMRSVNPKRRLANLGKKLRSILDLEKIDYNLLNEDQHDKLLRKSEILNEMKSLQQILNGNDATQPKDEKTDSLVNNVELLEINANRRSKSNKSTGGLDMKGGPQTAYTKKSTTRAELSSLKRNAKPLDKLVTSGKVPRTLLKMMIFCRVAGSDTCRLLLEMGRVKVNGQVEKSQIALVDLEDDIIEVEGERLGVPEDKKVGMKNVEDDDEEDNEDGNWNNFRKTIPKEYRATLDGGTLIDLTRSAQKSKGTYVDKSAYANKQPFVYGDNYKRQRYSVGKSASNFQDNRNAVASGNDLSLKKRAKVSDMPRRRPSTQR